MIHQNDLRRLQQEADALFAKDRGLAEDLARAQGDLANLTRGLSIDAADIKRAERLRTLQRAQRDARPSDLPPAEALELHDLGLDQRLQPALRVLDLCRSISVLIQNRAQTSDALKRKQGELDKAREVEGDWATIKRALPAAAEWAEMATRYADTVEGCAEALGRALRDFAELERTLGRLIDTPRSERTLDLTQTRLRLANAFQGYFEAGLSKTGDHNVHVTLKLEDARRSGPCAGDLREQSWALYVDLLRERMQREVVPQ